MAIEGQQRQTHDYVDVQARSALDTTRYWADTGMRPRRRRRPRPITNQCTNAAEQDIAQRRQSIDHPFDAQGKRVNVVDALGAAMNTTAPGARVKGVNQFGMGLGHFRNPQARGGGYNRLISPNVSVRVSVAFVDGENRTDVGFNVGW